MQGLLAADEDGNALLDTDAPTALPTLLDDGVPARELASLSKRLVDIAEEIAEIDADKKGDDVGDAAATPDEPF